MEKLTFPTSLADSDNSSAVTLKSQKFFQTMSLFAKTVEFCTSAFFVQYYQVAAEKYVLFTKLAKLFMVRYKVAQEITVK